MPNAAPLNPHEQAVFDILLDKLSFLTGFPDTDVKMQSVTRAYARFASTDPYEVKPPAHLARFLTEDEVKSSVSDQMWKHGIVPMAWLADKIADTCRFFPMPIEARRIYCKSGFHPLDGKSADAISNERDGGEKRAEE